ncbi:MAG: transposase [Ignavibacteria bacterium]|nr:MAG: transposase [Ignavibacteria bacterium]KAF0156134.1 MAG: transposase [Ignavibacteria bacterium]
MMSKFKNSYKIESTRLKDWDYSTPWWYYITINEPTLKSLKLSFCTLNLSNNQSIFSSEIPFYSVENKQVVLNELGNVAQTEWRKSKELRKNIDLDYFVVMPNHIHGIIILNEINVETCRGKSLQETERVFSKPIKNSLSIIINQFKGSVKRWANGNGYSDFTWQSRFYDRIIRNEKELYNIRRYIEQNPLKWEFEKNQPENIFM